uniref:Uncharacterized protein n=1 Tax=Anguilla anguilla TaxID=7936 RepID=A0A0E9QTJ8_ANGAN
MLLEATTFSEQKSISYTASGHCCHKCTGIP